MLTHDTAALQALLTIAKHDGPISLEGLLGRKTVDVREPFAPHLQRAASRAYGPEIARRRAEEDERRRLDPADAAKARGMIAAAAARRKARERGRAPAG
jgi:hypothetical protein